MPNLSTATRRQHSSSPSPSTRRAVTSTTLRSPAHASPGLSDAEIVEVVAHVALNVFTNYLNTVAKTAIDFPEVAFAAAA